MRVMIKHQTLKEQGYLLTKFPLDEIIKSLVIEKNWKALDDHFLEISLPGKHLHTFLSQFLDFEKLEHIIAIRSAPDDEDGIWHDDGSRLLGFSLSLNLNPTEIKGGVLSFRAKGTIQSTNFPPLEYGQIVLFLSGTAGFEHMVSAVTQKTRIVIAGWCS